MKTKGVLFAMLPLILVAIFAVASAGAQPAGSDATSILKKMSEYVSSQKTIEFTFDSDIEIITPQLEKFSSPIPARHS